MSAFNVNTSSQSPNAVLSKKTLEGKKMGGKHNVCYQSAHQPLSFSPQQQPQTTGAKHTKRSRCGPVG
jgi:hypothetical protein